MTTDDHRDVRTSADQPTAASSPLSLHGIGNASTRRVGARSRSPQLLTVDQAADRLNTTVRFVRRLIAERRIPFTKLGRHVRIDTADIDAFIAAGRIDTLSTRDLDTTTDGSRRHRLFSSGL